MVPISKYFACACTCRDYVIGIGVHIQKKRRINHNIKILHTAFQSNHSVSSYSYILQNTKRYFCGTNTVKNRVFQNSFLGVLHVHSSTTPNRMFLKPPFEGVTEHPQNTLPSGSESLKVVLCKNCTYTLLILKRISLCVILKLMK